MSNFITRRRFLKQAGVAAGYTAAIPGFNPLQAALRREVRLGIVGVGNRGRRFLRTLLDIENVVIQALCDINPDNLSKAQDLVIKASGVKPEGYAGGPEDYKRMVQRDDLDGILTATPRELHTPVMVAAMRAGKYGATEVPAATTVEECWNLVRASEEAGLPCMMLENICYIRNVMMVLNMVRRNLFGELLHCEGGYQHAVRPIKYDEQGELIWRGKRSESRNGNLRPAHPVGPIALWLNINRGDKFDFLVSMSSPSRLLQYNVKEILGSDHLNVQQISPFGNITTTLLKTRNGATVTLYNDQQSPRPHGLIFRVQGTEGIYSGTLNKIYIEKRAPKLHQWEDLDAFRKEFKNPGWKQWEEAKIFYGHGFGEYMALRAFVNAVRKRVQTPHDVYDAATWSVISPLSEISATQGNSPVDFPDFTRGKWHSRPPTGIIEV